MPVAQDPLKQGLARLRALAKYIELPPKMLGVLLVNDELAVSEFLPRTS
jgi:hypothetical protein